MSLQGFGINVAQMESKAQTTWRIIPGLGYVVRTDHPHLTIFSAIIWKGSLTTRPQGTFQRSPRLLTTEPSTGMILQVLAGDLQLANSLVFMAI